MRRLSVVVALALSACAQSRQPVEGATVRTGQPLATFTGEADLAAGTVVVSGQASPVTAPLGSAYLTLPTGSITIQNETPTSFWLNDKGHGCGDTQDSWGASVTVSNQLVGSYLSGVFARIDVATPLAQAEPCSSVPGPAGWSTAGTVGLFSFGSTSAGPSAASNWAFKRQDGTRVTFSGTLYGAKVTPVVDADAPWVTGQAKAQGNTVVYPSYNGFGIVAADGTVTPALNLGGLLPGAIAVDAARIWWIGWRGYAGFTDRSGQNPSTQTQIPEFIAPTPRPVPPPDEYEVDIGYGVAIDPLDATRAWLLTSSEGLGNPAVGLGADQGALRRIDTSLNFLGPYRFAGNPGGIVAVSFTDPTTAVTSTRLYVTNITNSTVDVWDTTDMTSHTSVPAVAGCETPGPIIVGPDGDLWFTAASAICKVTTLGVMSKVSNATSPTGLCIGPSNSVWYSSPAGLARVYVSGAVDPNPWQTGFSSGLANSPVTCTYTVGAGFWAAEGWGGDAGVFRFELFEP